MKLEMHNFQSTAIFRAAYDPDSRLLVLCFTSDRHLEYDYPGVPMHIWQGLLRAASKGAYYNQNIRDAYGQHRISRQAFRAWR